MKLHTIEFVLVMIGALNWGILGLGGLMGHGMDWNVVHMILQQWAVVENIVYLLVGLSAIGLMVSHKKDCRMCSPGGAM